MDQKTNQPTKKQMNLWFIVSLVLAVALVGMIAFSLVGNSNKEGEMKVIKSDAAAKIVMDYINEVFAERVGEATLKGVVEKNGLYEITVEVTADGNPVEQKVFATKDGEFFIPQSFNISETLTQYRDFVQQQNAAAQQGAGTPTDTNVNSDANVNTNTGAEVQQ
jgi:hypothetical protein